MQFHRLYDCAARVDWITLAYQTYVVEANLTRASIESKWKKRYQLIIVR